MFLDREFKFWIFGFTQSSRWHPPQGGEATEGHGWKGWLFAECYIERHSWKKKKRVHKQQGRLQPGEGCQAKPIQEVGGALQGVDRGCSQCIKSQPRVQEIGYKSHIPGVKPLLNLLLLVLWVLSSPESTNLNVYQEILERFMLPSAGELYVDADFLLVCDSSPQRICRILSRGGWETADLTIQMS